MASRDLTINILGKNESAKKALNETSGLTKAFGVDTSSASSLASSCLAAGRIRRCDAGVVRYYC